MSTLHCLEAILSLLKFSCGNSFVHPSYSKEKSYVLRNNYSDIVENVSLELHQLSEMPSHHIPSQINFFRLGVVLGFELRATHLLGRQFETHP
jgi:hypothetical protein